MASIAGQFSPDIVKQSELRRIADLQAAEWVASQAAHKAVLRVMDRLRSGASVEPGEFYFDTDLKMARSRKAKTAGGTG